uniref:SWIM-type domain-containing protein n=1 Tax=Lactuca sativa TaxID=4236 RepID=A0A9R1W428_LACSA|nr:hypothetical protein LSAT_V11C300132960 [Lactuca sativa]
MNSGTRRICIPKNVDDVKPKLYSKYLSLDDAINMYKDYAAKVVFDEKKGFYKLYKFEERHNHDLVNEEYMHFLSSNMQLDNVAQEFIEKMGRVKIGPVKAYKIMQELRGTNNVGGTIVDYKNQSRKVSCFIGNDDVHMVVDKYLNKMKEDPSLTFEFIRDKEMLVSLFWVDEAAKVNYREFGDIVSFDATFLTNKKSVTFAIGLLNSESTKSYLWLLKTFLKTFGKQSIAVLIDGDVSMKIAIEIIFPDSIQQLCMKFRKRFNKLVWNSRIYTEKFVEDYKLQEITGFSKMFDMRKSWIPTYFRDMQLSGLMRTTSTSESMNSAFSKISHRDMHRQRHNQCCLDHLNNISKIKSKISLKFMEHAVDIYTNEVFIKVKKEIEQFVFSCSQHSLTNEEFYDRFVVMQCKDIFESTPKKESSFECSCSLFFQHSILCRHIFFIFWTYQLNKIPSKYILRHWCKHIIPSEVLMKQCSSDEASSSLYDPLSQSVSILSKDHEKLKEFFELIKEAKVKVDGVSSTSIFPDSLLKRKDISEFVESSYGEKKTFT